jgi:hypothetical protein
VDAYRSELHLWVQRPTNLGPADQDLAALNRANDTQAPKQCLAKPSSRLTDSGPQYAAPYLVEVHSLARDIYNPKLFPLALPEQPHSRVHLTTHVRRASELGALSQSERDWAYAKRALARGEDPASRKTGVAVVIDIPALLNQARPIQRHVADLEGSA